MSDKIISKSEFLLYTSPEGDIKIEVFFQDETVWLTQKKMAFLFDVDIRTISEHLQNIFKSNELSEKAVIRKIRTTADDGKDYLINFYSLDAIIAVGYRVNSKKATYFRIWAIQVLKDFIIKGFALDDKRLKQGSKLFGVDYFRELLERVRSIRSSERRIWLQITDIFSECSIDYLSDSKDARDFYAMIQNKFHFAIVGHTAAEIIYSKADKTKENMGLTTWENSPGRILQSDVVVAKNYLQEKEIKKLERTVTGFFDYIEGIIERKSTFTMKEFTQSVDKFLTFNEYEVLDGKGNISASKAKNKAISEYQEFNKTQKIESDFDKEVKKVLEKRRDKK